MNGKWPGVELICAATSLWLVYDIMTATEAPQPALAVLQYALLACSGIGLVGLLLKRAAGR